MEVIITYDIECSDARRIKFYRYIQKQNKNSDGLIMRLNKSTLLVSDEETAKEICSFLRGIGASYSAYLVTKRLSL